MKDARAHRLHGGYTLKPEPVRSVQGLPGLSAELSAELERMWLRNLGRDDRLVADRGREARHPFLDEALIDLLQGTPLPLIADFHLPPGATAVPCCFRPGWNSVPCPIY